MSKQTLYILGILATIITGSFFYNKLCCQNCCVPEPQIQAPAKPALTDNAGMGDYNIFNLSGNGLTYTCHDNFRFLSNGFNNIQPVNDSINSGIGMLKSYFDKNKTEKLVITGFALNSEKNTSAFPNLGIARANDIKNYFISKGLNANQFETLGELRDTWKVEKDTVLGAVDFKIKQAETDANSNSNEDWSALKEKINANPLILYFKTNQNEVILSADQRQKIADLTKYLDNVSGSRLECTGYTDNVGNAEKNIKLGQDRADFAKAYLAKNGISNDRIDSSSKGPENPTADNKTASGRTKNRRTEVTLK
jgi:OmpA-OmpF porin, OOP family